MGLPNQMAISLSVSVTIAEALRLSWSNRQLFGRFMILPVAMATLLGLVSLGLYDESDQTVSSIIWSFGIFIPDFLVLTWFAVACHRLILIGAGAVAEFGLTRWTWRETRFFLWMLLVYTIGYLFMLLGNTTLFAVAFFVANACGFSTQTISLIMEHQSFLLGMILFASIPFAYVVGRLSLLLPATAIDLHASVNSAWDLSEGNGWRVAILVGGVPMAFMAIQASIWMIPSWLFGESVHETQAVVDITSISSTFLSSVFRYALATVEIAILSITYRRLRTIKEQELVSPAVI